MMEGLNMKRLFIFVLALICLASTGFAGDNNGRKKIIFYNWTAYIDEGVVKDFEKKFNTEVVQKFFQSADERDENLMRNGGKGYDVFMLTAADLPPYTERGWLMPLGESKIPNLKYMDRRFIDPYPKVDEYAVPYLWGTTGLIWRSDIIKEPITSWRQFYLPKAEWKGHVMLINQYRIGFGFALKAMGYSYNSEIPDEVAQAGKLLINQKPFVQTYGYLKTDAESGIVSGDTWIGQTWSGDALLLKERNPAIRYIVPKEGGEIMLDFLVVSSFSKEFDLAAAFVNWLHEPKNAAACAESLQFATPNKEAVKLLPKTFLDNPIINPNMETLNKSEAQKTVNVGIQRQMITLWSQLIH